MDTAGRMMEYRPLAEPICLLCKHGNSDLFTCEYNMFSRVAQPQPYISSDLKIIEFL